jgi:hypothetical protein
MTQVTATRNECQFNPGLAPPLRRCGLQINTDVFEGLFGLMQEVESGCADVVKSRG